MPDTHPPTCSSYNWKCVCPLRNAPVATGLLCASRLLRSTVSPLGGGERSAVASEVCGHGALFPWSISQRDLSSLEKELQLEAWCLPGSDPSSSTPCLSDPGTDPSPLGASSSYPECQPRGAAVGFPRRRRRKYSNAWHLVNPAGHLLS